jgi:hypothetical protein
MIAARAEEFEEAFSEPESTDPGHGSYQNESVATRALTLSMSPQNSVSTLFAVAVGAALSEVAHNLVYDRP